MFRLYFLVFVLSFSFTFGYLYYFGSPYSVLKSYPFSKLIDYNYNRFLNGDYSVLNQIPSSGNYIYVDEKMFREVK